MKFCHVLKNGVIGRRTKKTFRGVASTAVANNLTSGGQRHASKRTGFFFHLTSPFVYHPLKRLSASLII
jgi:hypothetical protein